MCGLCPGGEVLGETVLRRYLCASGQASFESVKSHSRLCSIFCHKMVSETFNQLTQYCICTCSKDQGRASYESVLSHVASGLLVPSRSDLPSLSSNSSTSSVPGPFPIAVTSPPEPFAVAPCSIKDRNLRIVTSTPSDQPCFTPAAVLSELLLRYTPGSATSTTIILKSPC